VTFAENLRFTPQILAKPPLRGLSAETTLQHFVIITYWVDPSILRKHLHSRFEPVCLAAGGKSRNALVSTVTFLDHDFRFSVCPWFKRSFGQTNYRAYVLDTQTGEYVAWFFGTCLDSISVAVPRYLWRLPWHRARMNFDCRYDQVAGRYATFHVETQSRWGPARLAIEDTGTAPTQLAGISNLEAGLVLLTHPMRGYFFRQDGELGSYSIWHDRAQLTLGRVQEANYPLLQQLGLVEECNQSEIHSVLVQPKIDFVIYLPPHKVNADPSGN
jgi:uncharacterized protein YqjF (DUF2071 family)